MRSHRLGIASGRIQLERYCNRFTNYLYGEVGELFSGQRGIGSSCHQRLLYTYVHRDYCTNNRGNGSTNEVVPTSSVPSSVTFPRQKRSSLMGAFPCVKTNEPDQLLPEQRWKEIQYRENPNALVRIQRLPLCLIEELQAIVRVLTDIELLQTAWTEQQAARLRATQWILRGLLFASSAFFLWLIYTVTIAAERKKRGQANMPPQIKIGSVVYLDISEEGRDPQRVVIGLFIDQCPLYCEYFHRMCTGNFPDGTSFVGQRVSTLLRNHAVMFGSGMKQTHGVPDFAPHSLPPEYESNGPWRGALSAIGYSTKKQSPNFVIHLSAGDYTPQVFGMVIGGFDVMERINHVGSRHGAAPKREFQIVSCGELCTLDKSRVTPLPWALYSDVSYGYDRQRFAAESSRDPETIPEDAPAFSWERLLEQDMSRRMKEVAAKAANAQPIQTTSRSKFFAWF